jgi:type IV fimbrial biogenesis protein FimT
VTTVGRSRPWRQGGFTLIELLITIGIAAILTVIAVPSLKYVINDNRMAGEVNDLLGDMQYARAEAIKEGNNVVVCSSTSGTSCSGAPAWQTGWIIYSDPDDNGTLEAGETILRVHAAFSGSDTFVPADNTTNAVQFNRDGFAIGLTNAGVTLQLHDATDSATWSRCLAVSIVGALYTASYGGALPGGGTCQ